MAATPTRDAPSGTASVQVAGAYEAANVAIGARSLTRELARGPYHHVYALTRGQSYRPPEGLEGVIPIHDAMDLARRYSDSDDELLVAGGPMLWHAFTPYARRIDVVELDAAAPRGDDGAGGDVVYAEYDNGEFRLESQEEWDGGRTLHYVRTRVAAQDDVRPGPLEP